MSFSGQVPTSYFLRLLHFLFKVASVHYFINRLQNTYILRPSYNGSYLKQKGQNDNIHGRKVLNVLV